MKKKLVFLIGFLLSLSTFGQSDYSRGFQNGYKIGFCYNEFGCIPPIPPLTPLPRLRESRESYQDGYNRGFKQGIEDKQAKNSSSSVSSDSQENYSAPFLGESSHDPVEFARRRRLASQSAAIEMQRQQSANFDEGIKRYSIEIEGWEDQKGYEELNKKNTAIRDVFMELNAAGLNLINPRSEQELVAYKALNEAMDDIRYKSAIRQTQKLAYDAATKIIFEQLLKKESERTIDISATRLNMNTLLNTTGILNRSKITENLIVYKQATEDNEVNFNYSTLTDIEGNTYKTILIGDQIWMAENLRSTYYNDGTPIPLVTETSDWSSLSSPAFCWYENNIESYKKTYGALYNWFAVNTGKLCPKGWHVPSDAEWHKLILYLDVSALFSNPESLTAGGKLKSIDFWQDSNIGATNSSGFNALPAGNRYVSGHFSGKFGKVGLYGQWWTASESRNITDAWERILYSGNTFIYRGTTPKVIGQNVRCLAD